ncbi:MAG: hypothetical protein ACM3O6_09000, partial [Acidobacteriota bacterium]
MRFATRRRLLVIAGTLFASPVVVLGQQSRRVYRVGWLGNSKLDTPESIAGWDAYRLEMRRLGWEEGRNLQF